MDSAFTMTNEEQYERWVDWVLSCTNPRKLVNKDCLLFDNEFNDFINNLDSFYYLTVSTLNKPIK